MVLQQARLCDSQESKDLLRGNKAISGSVGGARVWTDIANHIIDSDPAQYVEMMPATPTADCSRSGPAWTSAAGTAP